MSRRKQAKPRAFLKLGDEGTEGDERPQQSLVDLADPREDNAEQSLDDELEDDEDEYQPQQQPSVEGRSPNTSAEQHQHLVSNNNKDNTKTITSNGTAKIHYNNNSNSNSNNNSTSNNNSNLHNNNENNNSNNNSNNTIVGNHLENASVAVAARLEDEVQQGEEVQEFGQEDSAEDNTEECNAVALHPQPSEANHSVDNGCDGNDDDDDDDDDDGFAVMGEDYDEVVDEDDDDDYEDDDLDLRSLDSFYSDVYSTHTSSSYSPSVSDGTMTPNSLHAAHHHQLHHAHLQQQQQPSLHTASHDDEEAAATRRHPRHAENNNNININGDLTSVSASEEVGAAESASDGGVDKRGAAAGAGDTRLNGAAAAHAVEQQLHPLQHRNRVTRCRLSLEHAAALKLPKLRRGEREAAKFAKTTADGVKGGAAGGGGAGGGGAAAAAAAADGSYQCQFCDKNFPRLGYLKKHEQSHAEHLPFKCDYCARLFKHKRSRDRHTKLHTGDRRYRCPHCEAAFSRSDHLKIHMKTHDNQKPFQCTICNRGYNTAAALTSHMQNHKKQAALLAAGGNPQALNYSPRSTGSASSSGGSLQKRRYGAATTSAAPADSNSSPSRLAEFPKRLRSTFLACIYCTRNDFASLEQLNAHVQSMHGKELQMPSTAASETSPPPPPPPPLSFQLSCEFCSLKFPNIPAMFQHMRSTHIDRLTSSPNSHLEHFSRLAATATFSPPQRPAAGKRSAADEQSVKVEANLSSPRGCQEAAKQEQPTDLSRNKRRSLTPAPPASPSANPPALQQQQQHQQQHQQQQHQQQPFPRAAPEKPGVFLCNQCSAGLPDFESFRSHLKSHLARSASRVCHHCGLTLREPAEFERHVISHFLITRSEFSCAAGGCQQSYAKLDELQQHLAESHVATLLKCLVCAELFDSKVAIQVHLACAHSPETKILRCSACMDVFHAETDFSAHVKTRHRAINGAASHNNTNSSHNNNNSSLQCVFCRTVCSSDLEMHFHLAAHARQFRCPSCPETFHVEFLLDRHMQSQHGGLESGKDSYAEHPAAATTATTTSNNHHQHVNSIYMNALFGKSALLPLAAQNNNSSALADYNAAAFAAAQFNKGFLPAAAAAAATAAAATTSATSAANPLYNPLQVDTSGLKHPALMYGLSQRYFDTSRSLLDAYVGGQQQQERLQTSAAASSFFVSPPQMVAPAVQPQPPQPPQPPHAEQHQAAPNTRKATLNAESAAAAAAAATSFSCGICERNDFRTESELHSHRKIAHNMKTGVSLRCAYCCGNFKSRSELEHHMKTCHSSSGKHKCLICDEVFPSPALLAEHRLQHSKVGRCGKCSHCAQPLQDVAAFKAHLPEHNGEGHQMPVQCICCRQSLHSDFEIALHAKFHTKSSNAPEAVCALCLESIPHAPSETKVCENCCRKHNASNNAFGKQRGAAYERISPQSVITRQCVENRCHLCKMVLPHAQKLQEHLVEHTFAGCEERGFNCYICSTVFTAAAGLLNHLAEHGANARPYDCSLCAQKFYFRAELDHHAIEHELRDTQMLERKVLTTTPAGESGESAAACESERKTLKITVRASPAAVKKEVIEEGEREQHEARDEDDEYIEVEKVSAELAQTTAGRTATNAEAAAGQLEAERQEAAKNDN